MRLLAALLFSHLFVFNVCFFVTFLGSAELDAIGTKRYGGEQSGDREVQRTMLELLNQLDGFSSNDKIKVRVLSTLAPTLSLYFISHLSVR